MQIGSYTVEVLSEGRFEIFKDGHINRAEISQKKPGSNLNMQTPSAVVGINPILVKAGPYNIVLDTGLGWGLDAGSDYSDVSNVRTNLEIFGLRPKDITHVILSHLHYDHAAGCSFTNVESNTQATFPNATYYVHQREWEYALTQIQTEQQSLGADYRLDDFYRLIADEKVTLLNGNSTEIIDGITAIWTGGHTPGHQIVTMHNNGDSAYYLGDLLPSSAHLNRYAMSKLDTDPRRAKKKKIQLLRSAFEQKAYLFFYHSQHSEVGNLEKGTDKQYVLNKL